MKKHIEYFATRFGTGTAKFAAACARLAEFAEDAIIDEKAVGDEVEKTSELEDAKKQIEKQQKRISELEAEIADLKKQLEDSKGETQTAQSRLAKQFEERKITMAKEYKTTKDLAIADAGAGYDIVADVAVRTPELDWFPADHSDGDVVKLTVQQSFPEVQFRMANEGIPPTKGDYIELTFSAAKLASRLVVDAQEIDNKKPETKRKLLLAEEKEHIAAMAKKIAKTIWYGRGKDENDFPGIVAQMDKGNVVNAGGTTNKTSVFILALSEFNCELRWANGQTIHLDEEYQKTTVAVTGGVMEAYTKWLKASPFLELKRRKSVARIKNIGTDEGKGLTGDLLRAAIRKLTDNNFKPSAIFLNSDALEQYRKTLISDLVKDPDTPTTFQGLPFVVTTNIVNGETV